MRAIIIARTVCAVQVIEILNAYDLRFQHTIPEYFGSDELVIFSIEDVKEWFMELRSVLGCRFTTDEAVIARMSTDVGMIGLGDI